MSSPLGEVAVQVGTGAAFLWTSWQAWQGKRQAMKANQQTKATGNGFARHTTESLQELLAGQARVEGKIDRHLEDHAASDLRR